MIAIDNNLEINPKITYEEIVRPIKEHEPEKMFSYMTLVRMM